jgi:hypothetical protein
MGQFVSVLISVRADLEAAQLLVRVIVAFPFDEREVVVMRVVAMAQAQGAMNSSGSGISVVDSR